MNFITIGQVYISIYKALRLLFDQYSKRCVSERGSSVSIDKFRRVITEQFNTSFKGPKAEPRVCDHTNVDLKIGKSSGNETETNRLQIAKEVYLHKAETTKCVDKCH